MAGYHKADITRGTFGEISKIEEELAELKDAMAQGVRIMALCELSDLIGRDVFGLNVHLLETPDGIDIMSPQGMELGSYGIREVCGVQFVYGTGLAEPRASYALGYIKGGGNHEDSRCK